MSDELPDEMKSFKELEDKKTHIFINAGCHLHNRIFSSIVLGNLTDATEIYKSILNMMQSMGVDGEHVKTTKATIYFAARHALTHIGMPTRYHDSFIKKSLKFELGDFEAEDNKKTEELNKELEHHHTSLSWVIFEAEDNKKTEELNKELEHLFESFENGKFKDIS